MAQKLEYEQQEDGMQIDFAEMWQNETAREAIRLNTPFRLVHFDIPLLIKEQQILEATTARIIAGYANIEVVDTQGELIPAETWNVSFAKFMSNPKFRLVHVFHTDIPVGEVLPSFKDSKGRIWKSHVDEQGLFVVVKIRMDTIASDRIWQAIEDGDLRAFSISGLALERDPVPKHRDGQTYRVITKLELHSITICERGSNPGAIFTIVKSILPIRLLRMQTQGATRPSMSLEEEILTTNEDGSPSSGQKPPEVAKENTGKPASGTAPATEKKQESTTAPQGDISAMMLEIKGALERLAGEVQEIKVELGKAKKPAAEEEEGTEKAGKPQGKPYPEGKAGKPDKYPYPEGKGKKPTDEETAEEEEEEDKARKPNEKYPGPEKKKGEVSVISAEDLGKMIEEKATELINKSLGKTEKRGEVLDIGGGVSGSTRPTAINVLKMPMAKMGTMGKQEWLGLIRSVR